MKTKEIINHATSLPIEERIIIADILLHSINRPDTDIDAEWRQVARKRLADIQNKRVEAVPGQVVFEKIWSRFVK